MTSRSSGQGQGRGALGRCVLFSLSLLFSFRFLELPISYCVPCSKDVMAFFFGLWLLLALYHIASFFSLFFCFLGVMNYDYDAVPLNHYVDCLEHGSVVGN
jgi:hypothetical protein